LYHRVNISFNINNIKRITMKKIVTILCVLGAGLLFADGFKDESQMRAFSDKFMDNMIQKEFKKGFDSAKLYWPLPTVEIDSLVNQIEQQWPIIDQRFGKVVGREFVKEEKIGQSFMRYYYLHKFNNHAMYWRIGFYKAKDEWKINSINYLDSLDNLYE